MRSFDCSNSRNVQATSVGGGTIKRYVNIVGKRRSARYIPGPILHKVTIVGSREDLGVLVIAHPGPTSCVYVEVGHLFF